MTPRHLFARRSLAVTSVARSHVGLVRQINEDRVFDCPERRLWAVADGMGGHSGGDVAAQTVVDALRVITDISAEAMVDAIHHASKVIAERNRMLKTDAGSTVVAAHLADTKATVAWVGDSRAYLLRQGMMRQLTQDHSVVQELIDAGLLTEDAATRHPNANVVTRALGISAKVEIATVTLELVSGDRLILCSDGLSRSLRHTTLHGDHELEKLADRLVSEALGRDGSDNISLVCIEGHA